jgi:hypothetical protein
LDDFFILSGQNKNVYNQSLKTFLKICNTLGVPIKEEKTVYAQTIMTFLGIELDTIAMEARLSLDKVLKIKNSLSEMRMRRKVTLRELQSLIGLLNFACCVVQPGRTFLRRLIDRTKGIQQPHFHIRLNKESRLDIAAWLLCIEHFNGKTMLLKQIWISTNKLHLYTDAAGALGCGANFESEWFYGSWNELVKHYPITYKELYPIVLSVEVWGSQLANKCVVFHSDNIAVVYIINKQTSKDPYIMRLVRRFVVACMKYNILRKAVHIQGHKNVLADLAFTFSVSGVQKESPIYARSSYDSGSNVPCQLINTAKLLLDAVIAANTKSTYNTVIHKFLIFLDKYFPKAELVDFTVESLFYFWLIYSKKEYLLTSFLHILQLCHII